MSLRRVLVCQAIYRQCHRRCSWHEMAYIAGQKRNRLEIYDGPYFIFLHDRSWISPWIKSISNELDIIIHVIASQLSGYCDVINNRLWRHQQNVNLASEARGRCVKNVFSSFLSSLCRVRNKIMYEFSWRTVSALTRVLFWCLFPSLLRKSGNKHQNKPSRERWNSSSLEYIHHSLYGNNWYYIPYFSINQSPTIHTSEQNGHVFADNISKWFFK